MQQNSLYGEHVLGYPVDPRYSVNIDSWNDLQHAERLIRSLQTVT
jgi:hypothetical protein